MSVAAPNVPGIIVGRGVSVRASRQAIRDGERRRHRQRRVNAGRILPMPFLKASRFETQFRTAPD